MQQTNENSTAWALTLLLAMFLQVAFAFGDATDTPSKAAVEFSKAYFRLDPAMSKRICNESKVVDEVNVVDAYLYNAEQEARALGYGIGMAQKGLYHIQTTVMNQSDDQAEIHISGTLRTRINPVYAWVATLFHLGHSEHMDQVLHLVKEDGKWKVCGSIYALSGQ